MRSPHCQTIIPSDILTGMISRRGFVAALASPLLAQTPEPIIDIHQHTNYLGRANEDLILHQRTMGVTQTILLPAGSAVAMASTHQGKSNGLAAWDLAAAARVVGALG